jgi:hypothetical protein
VLESPQLASTSQMHEYARMRGISALVRQNDHGTWIFLGDAVFRRLAAALKPWAASSHQRKALSP